MPGPVRSQKRTKLRAPTSYINSRRHGFQPGARRGGFQTSGPRPRKKAGNGATAFGSKVDREVSEYAAQKRAYELCGPHARRVIDFVEKEERLKFLGAQKTCVWEAGKSRPRADFVCRRDSVFSGEKVVIELKTFNKAWSEFDAYYKKVCGTLAKYKQRLPDTMLNRYMLQLMATVMAVKNTDEPQGGAFPDGLLVIVGRYKKKGDAQVPLRVVRRREWQARKDVRINTSLFYQQI